jgi:DNA (cytosine-5)-methyltransferase 1
MVRHYRMGMRNKVERKTRQSPAKEVRDGLIAREEMMPPWTVVDLFSGAGGMSSGFIRHGEFRVIAAVDAELGKPCEGKRSLECNRTYAMNIGVTPFAEDLSGLSPQKLAHLISNTNPEGAQALERNGLQVLVSCAPCTGYSRTKPGNHLFDDPQNALVPRTIAFVRSLLPTVFLMENARELVVGNFRHHYHTLREQLEKTGYSVSGQVHYLSDFGLPQSRERAIVIAVRKDLELRTFEDLWEGYRVREKAVTVRNAISSLPPLGAGQRHANDPMHVCPAFASKTTLARLRSIPRDGGSWADLRHKPGTGHLLTPAMKRYLAKGDLGSHPDIYGRLWWDRPAVTIKRECAHVGNGRYSHPDQDRLLSVREMAILQGFPRDYVFVADGVSNMYRHVGDAVPPLISFQLAHLVSWILSGRRPAIQEVILPNTHLSTEDIEEAPGSSQKILFGTAGSLPVVGSERVGKRGELTANVCQQI